MASIMNVIRQCFFIPKPTLTDKELPDQTGRVFIVTGGYAGVGKELSRILYGKNGTVYVAGRSKDKGAAAIQEIKSQNPTSDGKLEFLQVDLADLPTIKASAEDFMKRESRLDVLTNNAGVMMPPVGSKSAQGYELQTGTNVLGPFLFTHFLTPLLQKTAASSPQGSVRVTWAASLATSFSPKGGVEFTAKDGSPKVHGDKNKDYAQSKASNYLLGREFQARFGNDGIVSNAWNPGNLRSELQRHMNFVVRFFVTHVITHPTVFGAYTELWAGWGAEPGQASNKDKYIGPWGRFVDLRQDIVDNKAGGQKLWEWCDKETAQYK